MFCSILCWQKMFIDLCKEPPTTCPRKPQQSYIHDHQNILAMDSITSMARLFIIDQLGARKRLSKYNTHVVNTVCIIVCWAPPNMTEHNFDWENLGSHSVDGGPLPDDIDIATLSSRCNANAHRHGSIYLSVWRHRNTQEQTDLHYLVIMIVQLIICFCQ